MSSASSSVRSEENDEALKYQDLFYEQAPLQDSKNAKPWWKTQFFVVEPALFGTWEGVFTSCLINIFGVVLFLRTGWMVGNVGIGLSMLIVVITVTVSLLASLSAIGLCERLRGMETGGVYYIVSRVLGGKIGGTVGVMYSFGLCIVSALYCTGFAESVTQTFNWDNIWAVRGVAIGTLLLLLVINLAGVKWVIRLQLLLLLILFISTCDFIIGTFVHTDPDAGFVGYSSEVMRNNSYSSLQPGESFFTVFGVFFPTATGIMAGVNMSGDLKNPAKSIPIGTLSAISISFFLYIVFVLLLGSTCLREALQVDFMIAEKVSAVGVLWLLGVYMSSTSSCSTGLYGAPRVLQSIANENVIPILKFLGRGFGANKTPVIAICIVGLVALIFILIGNLNIISPVITCNFMLVYAVVDYSYFALAMSYDLQVENYTKFKTPKSNRKPLNTKNNVANGYGSTSNRGTMLEFTRDLDELFKNSEKNKKEKRHSLSNKTGNTNKSGKECLEESFALNSNKNLLNGDVTPDTAGTTNEIEMHILTPFQQDTSPRDVATDIPSVEESLLDNTDQMSSNIPPDDVNLIDADDEELDDKVKNDQVLNEVDEILKQPRSCYSLFCNRWLSLFGMIITLITMFLINWIYALANISAFILIYLYTSLSNPGLQPGVSASFSFIKWIKSLFTCRKKEKLPEQYIVTPIVSSSCSVVSTILTKDNEDYSGRSRFHQSAVGDYDYASLVADSRSDGVISDKNSDGFFSDHGSDGFVSDKSR